MCRLVISCCMVAIMAYTPAYAAGENGVCHQFFDTMRTSAVAILRDRQHSFDQRYAELKTLFNKAVDTEWIARFAAGPYWRAASEQERKEFMAAYRTYLADHYIGGLNEDDLNSMKEIKVLNFIDAENNTYRVHTQIEQTNDEPVVIDYMLQEEPAGNCHLRDFTLEGVSLLTAQRDQVKSLAATGGLKAVTEKLAEMTRETQHSQSTNND